MRQEEHKVKIMTPEEIYQWEMAEMQKQVHALQIKVKELQEKLNAVLQLQEQKDR